MALKAGKSFSYDAKNIFKCQASFPNALPPWHFVGYNCRDKAENEAKDAS